MILIIFSSTRQVLSDNSVSKEERKSRAKGTNEKREAGEEQAFIHSYTHPSLSPSLPPLLGLAALGKAFKETADRCLAAAGGAVDYQKEWEALDREFMQR